jgi:hypothetical protein
MNSRRLLMAPPVTKEKKPAFRMEGRAIEFMGTGRCADVLSLVALWKPEETYQL